LESQVDINSLNLSYSKTLGNFDIYIENKDNRYNKILREDASTILKNTIEDCCEDLLCYGNYDNSKDIPCLFGSTDKEGLESL